MTRYEFIKITARSLAHLCYRNGYIEHLHGDKTKNLYDSDMKVLNKDIYNRIYTILLLFMGPIEYTENEEIANNMIQHLIYNDWQINYGSNWDEPEISKDLIFDGDEYKFIKELENMCKIENCDEIK